MENKFKRLAEALRAIPPNEPVTYSTIATFFETLGEAETEEKEKSKYSHGQNCENYTTACNDCLDKYYAWCKLENEKKAK